MRDSDDQAPPIAALLEQRERFERFLRRRVRSAADADDVLQTAFANALKRDRWPRDRTRVVAWFYRVLRRALLDHVRREDARARGIARRASTAKLGAETEDALRSTVCACVAGLLPTLRPEQADLLRRVELDGDAVSTVARTLGITPGNAAVRVHRARRALAARLEDVCGACTTHGCLRCTCADPGRPRGV
ncbi:MAG: sigma-70 family RNA polymerase sigma factor [Planctomycetota bacterium]